MYQMFSDFSVEKGFQIKCEFYKPERNAEGGGQFLKCKNEI